MPRHSDILSHNESTLHKFPLEICTNKFRTNCENFEIVPSFLVITQSLKRNSKRRVKDLILKSNVREMIRVNVHSNERSTKNTITSSHNQSSNPEDALRRSVGFFRKKKTTFKSTKCFIYKKPCHFAKKCPHQNKKEKILKIIHHDYPDIG